MLLLALAMTVGCSPDAGDAWSYAIPHQELGTELATGTGFAFDSPQAAWFAAEHVTPELAWSYPATNLPLHVWDDILYVDNVADPGTCPYLVAEGAATRWVSDCRSQDGYDWTGGFSLDEWSDAGWTYYSYSFDLEVTSELQDRRFDRARLVGEALYIDGDDAPLSRHAQVNWRIELEGWWSRGFEDELEEAWSSLAVTGTWETQTTQGGANHRATASTDLGAWGGYTTSIEQLSQNACVGEPVGEVVMSAGREARLVFEGEDRCDGCAALWVDGERDSNTCRSY